MLFITYRRQCDAILAFPEKACHVSIVGVLEYETHGRGYGNAAEHVGDVWMEAQLFHELDLLQKLGAEVPLRVWMQHLDSYFTVFVLMREEG